MLDNKLKEMHDTC